MIGRSAFTVLEVLVAVVLLAVVVAVCVPYLQAGPGSNDSAVFSEFAAQIDEALSQFKLTHAGDPTLDQLDEIVRPLGFRCDPAGNTDEVLPGRWAIISKDDFTTVRWVSVDPAVGESTP